MVFEEHEIAKIVECLDKSDELSAFAVKSKIEQLRKTSVNKRYSLRTTDWLSESAKKRKLNKKVKVEDCGGLV